ncbi:MAG TPA: cupredoxin domain-containing protein [Anaeromyxobacteraceae bacterium]|nr:cupredoxin domain-containing protein [Anaeromyxobacteraceae bacterium]
MTPPSTARTVLALLVLATAVPAAAQPRGDRSPPPKRENAPPPARDYQPPQPDRTVEITVTEAGFQPASVTVKVGERIRLVVKRLTEKTAAKEFVLDEFLVWQRLPLNQAVTETFVAGRPGEFPFRSQDGTVSGVFKVEE